MQRPFATTVRPDCGGQVCLLRPARDPAWPHPRRWRHAAADGRGWQVHGEFFFLHSVFLGLTLLAAVLRGVWNLARFVSTRYPRAVWWWTYKSTAAAGAWWWVRRSVHMRSKQASKQQREQQHQASSHHWGPPDTSLSPSAPLVLDPPPSPPQPLAPALLRTLCYSRLRLTCGLFFFLLSVPCRPCEPSSSAGPLRPKKRCHAGCCATSWTTATCSSMPSTSAPALGSAGRRRCSLLKKPYAEVRPFKSVCLSVRP